MGVSLTLEGPEELRVAFTWGPGVGLTGAGSLKLQERTQGSVSPGSVLAFSLRLPTLN